MTVGTYKNLNLFVTLIILLFSACSSEPYLIQNVADQTGIKIHEVYVVSHGWHTGFVIRARDISSHLPQLRERFGETSYLEFGWGDKGFYQAKKITTGLTLKAMFWPTESVVHVVAVPTSVEKYFPNNEVEKLCLSKNDYLSLMSFISNSFYRTESGNLLETQKGIYGESQFYQGVGHYYFMNTCNKWTAKGLKSAGMDISVTFKLTAGSVMKHMQEYNQTLNKTPHQTALICDEVS